MSSDAPLIEVAGLAGAGKSTLTRTLERRYGWRVADSLHTRARAHWPYVAHSLPGVLPIVARAVACPPPLSWDEVKLVVYISEWRRFLRANPHDRRGVTVLDQGPMFSLACLLWAQKPMTRTAAFLRWLAEMVDRWSVELDAIVWLEAPDRVLLERIDRRKQHHEAKGRPAKEGLELLESHRQAYTRLLELIEGLNRPRVLRFDTGGMSPVETADEVAGSIGDRSTTTLTDVRPGINVG